MSDFARPNIFTDRGAYPPARCGVCGAVIRITNRAVITGGCESCRPLEGGRA